MDGYKWNATILLYTGCGVDYALAFVLTHFTISLSVRYVLTSLILLLSIYVFESSECEVPVEICFGSQSNLSSELRCRLLVVDKVESSICRVKASVTSLCSKLYHSQRHKPNVIRIETTPDS